MTDNPRRRPIRADVDPVTVAARRCSEGSPGDGREANDTGAAVAERAVRGHRDPVGRPSAPADVDGSFVQAAGTVLVRTGGQFATADAIAAELAGVERLAAE